VPLSGRGCRFPLPGSRSLRREARASIAIVSLSRPGATAAPPAEPGERLAPCPPDRLDGALRGPRVRCGTPTARCGGPTARCEGPRVRCAPRGRLRRRATRSGASSYRGQCLAEWRARSGVWRTAARNAAPTIPAATKSAEPSEARRMTRGDSTSGSEPTADTPACCCRCFAAHWPAERRGTAWRRPLVRPRDRSRIGGAPAGAGRRTVTRLSGGRSRRAPGPGGAGRRACGAVGAARGTAHGARAAEGVERRGVAPELVPRHCPPVRELRAASGGSASSRARGRRSTRLRFPRTGKPCRPRADGPRRAVGRPRGAGGEPVGGCRFLRSVGDSTSRSGPRGRSRRCHARPRSQASRAASRCGRWPVTWRRAETTAAPEG